MRGSMTFQVTPDQEIGIKIDLYEMSETDLLRFSAALNEQALGLQFKLIQKRMKESESKQIIQAATDFKKQIDEKAR